MKKAIREIIELTRENEQLKQKLNKKPKHQPPSRIRYEKSHPVISFRMRIGDKQFFEKIREITGKSFPALIYENILERYDYLR